MLSNIVKQTVPSKDLYMDLGNQFKKKRKDYAMKFCYNKMKPLPSRFFNWITGQNRKLKYLFETFSQI